MLGVMSVAAPHGVGILRALYEIFGMKVSYVGEGTMGSGLVDGAVFCLDRGVVPTGWPVLSCGGQQTGKTTGGTRRCQLEGCRGTRIGVRWEDRRITWPCSDGMDLSRRPWRIE